ncbi:hypothetical protein N9939_00130 [bacterium]|nr:hypothetical protein [Akkermansiaceae bacterium]MDB4302227.1 hypothetical protein [bacterium]MDB4328481.1 hypothetical protein [Akkermansiaceae bacterium]
MKWILSLVIVMPVWAIPSIEEARRTFVEGNSKARTALTQELWTAGEEALPLVETFLKSDDPEIRSRATFLNQRILLGLRPDSPKELLAVAEAAMSAEQSQREKSMERLLDEQGGFEVAIRLLNRWAQDQDFSNEELEVLASKVLFHERLNSRRLEIPLSLECRALLVAALANEGLQERRIAVRLALPDPLRILKKATIFRQIEHDDLLLDLARGALLLGKKEDTQTILAMKKDADRQRLALLIEGDLAALIEAGEESEILKIVLRDFSGQAPADIEALRANGYGDPKTFAKVLVALGHPAEAIEVLHDTGNHRRVLAILLAQGEDEEALTYLEELEGNEGSDDILEARLFLTNGLLEKGELAAAKKSFVPLFDDVPKRVGHRQRTVSLAYRTHDLETALKLSRFIRPGFSTHEMVGDMGSLFPGRGMAMALWTNRIWEKEPKLSAAEAIGKAIAFIDSSGAYENAAEVLSKDELFEKKALQEMAIYLHRPEMISALEKKAWLEDNGHLLLPAITHRQLPITERLRACDIALAISPTSPLLHSFREILTEKEPTRSQELALDDAKSWIGIGKALGQAGRADEGYQAFEKALSFSAEDSSFELLKRLSLKKARDGEKETARRLIHAALIVAINDERVRCPDLLPLVEAL